MESLQDIFPLKGMITQEIIDKSCIYNVYDCIGANTLKEALGESISLVEEIKWGSHNGFIYLKDGSSLWLTTVEGTEFMRAKSPQEVTFIIK